MCQELIQCIYGTFVWQIIVPAEVEEGVEAAVGLADLVAQEPVAVLVVGPETAVLVGVEAFPVEEAAGIVVPAGEEAVLEIAAPAAEGAYPVGEGPVETDPVEKAGPETAAAA